MTNKTTQSSVINFKLCCVTFFSLFIFTQCARYDGESSRRATTAPKQQRVSPRQQQQYQNYQPSQYDSSYEVPNSRAYSNPYDFQPPYGQSPNSDNDNTYALPSEYYLR